MHVPHSRPQCTWQLKSRTLRLGERTLLMGIVNITPDSFSDGGQFFTARSAVDQSLRLLDEGADILDLGAESTRPSSSPVSSQEELKRLLPVLRGVLHERPDTILSVDTYHAATALAAIEAGAEIINDVSGLLWDDGMAAVLAERRPGAVLMHTRGRPAEWASLPPLASQEVMPLVLGGLTHTLALAKQAGILCDTLVVDPGFGFGKIGAANIVLLARLAELQTLGYPILTGTSRKRFLTAHLQAPTPEQRREATSTSNIAAILAGAHLIRVHDVASARVASAIADQILASRPGENPAE